MKILLTGAFGNLGTVCLEQALKLGYSVRCLDRPTSSNRKVAQRYASKVEIHWGDICDEKLLQKSVNGVDAILHNASLLPPYTEKNPTQAEAINVGGSRKLIRIAEQQEPKPVFVFPSSVTVFGLSEEGTVRTSLDPVEATDNYTHHKLSVESLLQQSILPWVILRVGVSVDARTLSTDRSTFRTLLSIKPNNPLEYIHPHDTALAMCRAANTTAAHKKILLIGGGTSCQVTHREFLSTAFQCLGLNLPKHVHGKETYYTHWMDTQESQSLLRYQQHSFQDYHNEMRQKLKLYRYFCWPFRWFIEPLLRVVLPKI